MSQGTHYKQVLANPKMGKASRKIRSKTLKYPNRADRISQVDKILIYCLGHNKVNDNKKTLHYLSNQTIIKSLLKEKEWAQVEETYLQGKKPSRFPGS